LAVIVADPTATPVTTPELLTVMTEVLLLLQVPPRLELYPLQSVAKADKAEHGILSPMGHRMGLGLIWKPEYPQQVMQPPPQVALVTL